MWCVLLKCYCFRNVQMSSKAWWSNTAGNVWGFLCRDRRACKKTLPENASDARLSDRSMPPTPTCPNLLRKPTGEHSCTSTLWASACSNISHILNEYCLYFCNIHVLLLSRHFDRMAVMNNNDGLSNLVVVHNTWHTYIYVCMYVCIYVVSQDQ